MASKDIILQIIDLDKKKNAPSDPSFKVKIEDAEELCGQEIKTFIDTNLSFAEQAAVITHYLLLRRDCTEGCKVRPNPYESTYRGPAEALISYWSHQLGTTEKSSEVSGQVEDGTLQYSLFEDVLNVPFRAPENPKFTFIDLFAGIGGFRMAFQNLGGECVFSSEWDDQAQKTYYANYGDIPFGDITKASTKAFIPKNFDILCAGFPCQAFSIAGKRGGFDDTRGTLFRDVCEILRDRRPKGFFLENVKGLTNHKGGKTLDTIINALNEVGYLIYKPVSGKYTDMILNARNFGVPQNRERIYIVGFRKDLVSVKDGGTCIRGGIHLNEFSYPTPTDSTKVFADIMEPEPVAAKYYLSNQYLKTLEAHKARHAAKGHGFGYEVLDKEHDVANAIVVGGMGRERNLIIDDRQTDLTPTTHIKGDYNDQGIRRMTPAEWGQLQGYPTIYPDEQGRKFLIPVSDASAYKQFGNSVAVPAIQATAEQMLKVLKKHKMI